MTLSDQLAAFVCETPLDAVPPGVRDAAAVLLLDAVGIAVGNRDQPFARAVRETLRAGGADGPCTLLGTGGRTASAEAAAEANSAAIHGSDLDATHIASIIHPTAIGVPVALAAGEEAGAAGSEVLAVMALGMEALIRLGLAAGGRYHVRGFQPTALLGSAVAALIAARLHGRDAAAASEAAGLATAVAAGLRSFSDDGTWGKRLITGWACRAGVHADALVEAGFRGSRDALEKRWGLYRAFLPEEEIRFEAITDGLGERWHLPDTEPKRYPCSHGLHPFIASSLAVRAEIGDGTVELVECRVNREAARWWFEPEEARYRPDAYAARFSIPYAVARALLDGDVSDASFAPEAVAEPGALALTARVRPVVDPALDGRAPVGLPGWLAVTLADGRRLVVDSAPHAGDGRAFVLDRAHRHLAPHVGPAEAGTVVETLLQLEDAPSLGRVLARVG